MGLLLEDKVVKLRALEPEDIDILYKWENDPEVWKVSNTIAPFSKYILRQFIDSQKYDIYETKQLRLIIESQKNQRPVGAIDLFDLDPFNCRAGVGILIYDEADRGNGYARAAIKVLITYCFEVLCLNQIFCNIPINNNRSLTLFKGKGFSIIGIKKEWTRTTSDWQDEYMLQLINPRKLP